MLNVEMKFTGDLEDAINKFAEKIEHNVIRSGAQAAAQVFYDEARNFVPVSANGHWFHGMNQKYWFEPGSLKAAIYQVYAKEQSGNGQEVYKVSFNHKKAPYGFMVEFGTSRAPAHPFMRPAYDAGKGVAGEAAMNRMTQKMSELK